MAKEAVKSALAAYAQPTLLRALHKVEVPRDALSLIQIAAGDETAITECCKACAVSPQELKEASVLYLRSFVSAAGQDKHRLLLLKRGATVQEVKAHMRWLLRWLHPDHNKSQWETVLFDKVRNAARSLESELKDLPSPGNLPVLVKPVQADSSHGMNQKDSLRHRPKLQQRRVAIKSKYSAWKRIRKVIPGVAIAATLVFLVMGALVATNMGVGANDEMASSLE